MYKEECMHLTYRVTFKNDPGYIYHEYYIITINLP